MLIPLGTDRPLARPTVVTLFLLFANVAVFTAVQAIARMEPERERAILTALWLNPGAITPWGFVSYAFLHGGFWHLIGNMAFLWVFGPNVEDRFGRVGFLVFYLAGGAASGGIHSLFSNNPVIGASGAIAAVTGAYLVLFPRTQIRALFLLYFGMFQVPAWWFIGGRIVWDFFATGAGWSGNVATGAHLAGYAFGFVVAVVLLWTRVLSREAFDLFSISKQAARRRQFREAQFRMQRDQRDRQRAAAEAAERGTLGDSDELAQARADVHQKLSDSDAPGAAQAYRVLLERFGESSALLNRKSQYDLANQLLQAGDHATAATAYRLFLKGYPRDAEVPLVRLMMGLIHARYLNDPVQAKQDLAAAIEGLPDGQERSLARELMAELG